jgi:hypothetical protein
MSNRPKAPERRDPNMVAIGYMNEYGSARTMDIMERDLAWAYKFGFTLIFRYRDDPSDPDIDPAQSNPRREDDGA